MTSSLRTRLVLQQTGLLALAFLILGILVNQSIRILSEQYVSDRLEQEIESLLAELSIDDTDRIQLDENNVDSVFHHTFSGHYYQIILRDGEQVVQERHSRSLGSVRLDLTPMPSQGEEHFFVTGPKQQPLMVLAKAMQIRELNLTIAVAEDTTAFLNSFYAFQRNYFLVSGVVFILLAVAQLISIKHGFRALLLPLLELRAVESGTHPRLNEEAPPEVRPLVETINRMIERSERRLERSRNALGNLSHSLKIPVSAIAQLGELPELDTLPEVRRALMESVIFMQRLIEHELKRARISDPSLTGTRFNLSREVPTLVRTLKSIYYSKHLTIECRYPNELSCRGDREDLTELLGGLLDNACKWATSRVLLRAALQDGTIRFFIEDDGPGCPEEVLQRLGGDAVRLDERGSSGHGHGLGLIITREIVFEYGGTIEFGRSTELGGFMVSVVLPLPRMDGGAAPRR